MEKLFFRIQRTIGRGREPSQGLLDELWCLYAFEKELRVNFILVFYKEMEELFCISLRQLRTYKSLSSTQFLLRTRFLSACLDHYEKSVTPKYDSFINSEVLLIRSSHQRVLECRSLPS